LDGYIQILFDFILADEFLQALRAEFEFERGIVFDRSGGDYTVFRRSWCRGSREIVFSGGH